MAHNMSFEELCCFSDFATFVITDIFIGRATFKTNRGFQPVLTRTQRKKLKGLLMETINGYESIEQIWSKIKGLTVIQSYLKDKTADEILKIDAHCIRYLKVMGPRSKFAVKKCDRFKADENEGVRIVAKDKITRGTRITGLEMCLSYYSNEEFDSLTEREKNYIFDTDSIGLGPAAWINHCCVPNAKFVWLVENSIMGVQAVKTIEANDEILVRYRKNYFGDECGCDICEEK